PVAQTTPDSLWEQSMEAIGVTPAAGAEVPATGGATVRRLPLDGGASGAASLAESARRVPSAHVQTNSRGEALIYLRGSGERQLVVTLDGAPLTLPWDRRVDLSLVPTWAVDRVVVATGTPSVAWGPNAVGGAVDLVPRQATGDGRLTEIALAGAAPEAGRVGAATVFRRGSLGATVALDALTRTGDPVASGASLPFSQEADALRTNTDRRSASGLARLAWTPCADRAVALTVLHTRARRGVAPESHLDPNAERVRFWRLPDSRQTLAVLTARTRTRLWRLRGSTWAGAARQTIESYGGAGYDAVEDEQRDRDRHAGARGLAELPRAWGVLRLSGYGLASEHREREGTPGDLGPEDLFSHVAASGGIEAETRGDLRLLGGAALDAMAPLATGGRPTIDPFSALALHAGAVWDLAPEARLRVGGGRKTRFPSMRELFGGALGRFAINPDLRPETAWLAEAGIESERGPLAGTLVAFVRDVDGTIEQVVLPDGRRQRQNLGGSWALGLESTVEWAAASGVSLSGALTLVRQRSDAGERLTERPAAVGRLGVRLARGPWRLHTWVDGIGGVVSPTPNGLVDLPGALLYGSEAGHQWSVRGRVIEATVRVENALDAVHVPQAGLPAPGRVVRAGVRLLLG
ncbi:MAG: TonB-dependent receptor, partial [Bacteroidota bacterium]